MVESIAVPAALVRAADAYRDWMWNAALPFWATTGRDPAGHGFVEHLTLDGVPADVPYKRMRVQARQIYVYANAALLGWPGAIEAAHVGYAFITRHGWLPEGGWARRLGRAGGVLDPVCDLYDHAFVLFALAWYARATGSAEALDWAWRTLDWLELRMRAPEGGFWNAVPREPGFRQQNPHMHLLEAALALYETSRETRALGFVAELIDLFRRRFFDEATGTLGEFFTDDWRPAPGEAGGHVEPGHHYEWVWLLRRYADASGVDLSAHEDRLYRFAGRHGIAGSGFVVSILDRDGALRDGACRLWAQTEAVKAHLAMRERTGLDVGETIEALVRAMLGGHLAHQPRGTWIDILDPAGKPAVDKIPASSFYHLFMAFAELERAVRG